MNEIHAITSRPTSPSAQLERGASERERRSEAGTGQTDTPDRVDLSEAAASYDPELAATRATEQRIQDIRTQIANGTYLTDEKLEAAIERLYQEICGA